MTTTRWALTILVAAGLAAPLLAGELGEKAKPLTIKEWVKGKPVNVTTADGKNVYVVEFWATWCGPCIKSIPHLTEMQKKYKDKNVTFVGVSVDSERTVDKVKPFVKKQGDKMGYTVAIDKEGATSDAYMKAFGVRGIPHAFIVDQKGRIIWHDHPANPTFEEVLEKTVAGKFDLAAAKKEMAKRKELEAQQEKEQRAAQVIYADVQKYFELVQSTGNKEEAAALAKKILERGSAIAPLMNLLSWEILTREGIVVRDLKLALKAAEAANRASEGEDPNILDTYALALFENGQKKKAVEVQTKAIELAKKNPDYPADTLAELKERLERFEKEPK